MATGGMSHRNRAAGRSVGTAERLPLALPVIELPLRFVQITRVLINREGKRRLVNVRLAPKSGH